MESKPQPSFFGSYQRIITITCLVIYYFTFYFSTILAMYSVLTLNLKLIFSLLLISLLQSLLHRSQPYIDFFNKYLKPTKYFTSFQVIYEEQIAQEKKCLFGCHPHAVLGVGFLAQMNYDHRPLAQMVCLASRFILSMPVIGGLMRLWGVQAVNPQSLVRLMKEGRNVGILPGGYEEATLTTKHQMRVYVQNRAGFIKYAFAYQYDIYPVIILNQHRAFSTFDKWKGFRLWLNKFKIPAVWYFNWKSLLFLTPNIDMVTVVGKPIQRKGKGTVSKEQIEIAHQEYIEELERIYMKYKHLNGNVPFKLY